MNLVKLKEELTNDPLPRGYSGMTDLEAADSLNVVNRTLNKATMTASEVANAIDKAEFAGLSNADELLIWNVLHLVELNPFGIEADLFVDAFGIGSATIANLQVARVTPVSRATELGLGRVREGEVAMARAS